MIKLHVLKRMQVTERTKFKTTHEETRYILTYNEVNILQGKHKPQRTQHRTEVNT